MALNTVLDLSEIFKRYSKIFSNAFKQKIIDRKSFDGTDYSELALSTVEGSKKGNRKRRRGEYTRLFDTGKFRSHAWKGTPYDNGFNIQLTDEYARKVVKYNDANSNSVNEGIVQPPYIVPRNVEDIHNMDAYKQMQIDISKTIELQLEQNAGSVHTTTVKLGI